MSDLNCSLLFKFYYGKVSLQTHRHTDTQTRRHTDTQTHTHTDTQTHTHIHI
jgi:hypothetical protein